VFPTVKGSYGTKPTLTFPAASPSSALQVKVLSEGKGPAIAKNDLMIADYLGQIWRGKVFDNSYDRKTPIATPIGAGQVIKGWDDALVGKKAGSRVLLVIPPAEGYGSAGQSSAGIKGTDTLAFVVDIVSSYSKANIGDTKAAVQTVSTAPVTVTGALGARPKIAIAKGAKIPTAAKTVVLAKSTGAPIKAGFVVLQYEAEYFNNTLADSTFVRGQPQATSIGVSGQANPFDGVIGVPIGSRVLITTPVQDSEGNTTGVAIVADVIGESGPAKAS
jgi:peptidylprolyl isomerase